MIINLFNLPAEDFDKRIFYCVLIFLAAVAVMILTVVCAMLKPKKFSLKTLLIPLIIGLALFFGGIGCTVYALMNGAADDLKADQNNNGDYVTYLTEFTYDSVEIDVDCASIELFTPQYAEFTELSVKYPTNSIYGFTVKNEIRNGESILCIEQENSFSVIQVTAPMITVVVSELLSNIKIDCDFGDVTLSGARCENLDLNCDAGEVTISDCEIANFNVFADLGSVNLTNVNSVSTDYDGALSAIQTVVCDMGNVKMNGCYFSNLSVQCDVGNIEFLELNGNARLYCSLGDIEGTFAMHISHYDISVNVDMGTSNISNQKASNDWNYSLTLTCDVGSVEVYFGSV